MIAQKFVNDFVEFGFMSDTRFMYLIGLDLFVIFFSFLLLFNFPKNILVSEQSLLISRPFYMDIHPISKIETIWSRIRLLFMFSFRGIQFYQFKYDK